MLKTLSLLLRQNVILLTLCGISLLASFLGYGWEWVAIVLVWFILYRLNVEEKIRKNWDYFHSLPLTLGQRALIKVWLPFLLAAAVLVVGNQTTEPTYVLDGEFSEDLLLAGLLVLSSILAQSLVSYVLIFWCLYFAALLFSPIPHSQLFLLSFVIGYSYLFLSSRRLAAQKVFMTSLLVAVATVFLTGFTRLQAHAYLLEQGSETAQITSARVLLVETESLSAKKFLEDRLKITHQHRRVDHILDAFEQTDLKVDFTVEQWGTLLSKNASIREEVLEHLTHDFDKYDWLTLERLYGWESLVFDGGESCDDDCVDLSRLIRQIDEPLDWNHYRAHLKSEDTQRILFAISVIRRQDPLALEKEIIDLLTHKSRKVRRGALKVLNDVGDLPGEVEEVLEEVSEALEEIDDWATENHDHAKFRRQMQKMKKHLRKSFRSKDWDF